MKRDKWTGKRNVFTSRDGYKIEAHDEPRYCGYPQWAAYTPDGIKVTPEGKTNIFWSVDSAKEACREHQLKVELATYVSHFFTRQEGHTME